MAKFFYTDIQLNKNQLLGARYENAATFPAGPALGQVFFNTADTKFYGWNGTAWVDLSQVILSPVTIKGEIANAASSPGYPASPGIGDTYFVTVQAGTVGTTAVEIGDELVYSASGWFTLQRNLQASTQAIAGFVRLATQAEAISGADALTAISPATLAGFLANFLYARKFRTLVTSLSAGVATTITHGLALLNMEDMHCVCYQGGQPVELTITPTSVNALTITSNQALGNVTVVIQG